MTSGNLPQMLAVIRAPELHLASENISMWRKFACGQVQKRI